MYTSDSDVTASDKIYNVDSSFNVERTSLSFAILDVTSTLHYTSGNLCVASATGFVAVGLAMHALRHHDPVGIE